MTKTVRINMNMSADLLQRLDDYADKCGISRSAVIAMCCDAQLKQMQVLNFMPVMPDLLSRLENLKSIADNKLLHNNTQ